MAIVSIIDTETTGISKDSRLVEFAAVHLIINPISHEVSSTIPIDFLIDPGVEIPPEASAVHHLTMEHITGAIPHDTAQVKITDAISLSTYVVAHNAAFDSKFVKTDAPWICTYRVAKHILDAPSYSNQALRYRLGLKPKLPDGLAPHRALYDALVTVELFLYLLKKVGSLADMHELTKKPILEKTLTFGAHRGKKFEDVPTSYLVWLQTLEDRSDDFKSTVAHHLAKRKGRS